MSLEVRVEKTRVMCVPRASGDEPQEQKANEERDKCSPRERG